MADRRTAPFIPGRRAALVLAILAGLLAGIGWFTFSYAEGGAYLSNDPNACANCHLMREYLDSWQKSSHHARATCNDCHTPDDVIAKYYAKAENGFRHSMKFTLQDYPERLVMTDGNRRNLQENCVGCHEALVRESAGRAAHGGPAELSCVHCHADVGHGARY